MTYSRLNFHNVPPPIPTYILLQIIVRYIVIIILRGKNRISRPPGRIACCGTDIGAHVSNSYYYVVINILGGAGAASTHTRRLHTRDTMHRCRYLHDDCSDSHRRSRPYVIIIYMKVYCIIIIIICRRVRRASMKKIYKYIIVFFNVWPHSVARISTCIPKLTITQVSGVRWPRF